MRQAPAGPKVTTQADRHRDDKPGIANPGCWAGFGGAVEDGETVEEALRREVAEETGLVITDPVFLTDAVDYEGDGRLVSLFYVVGDFQPCRRPWWPGWSAGRNRGRHRVRAAGRRVRIERPMGTIGSMTGGLPAGEALPA
ncbi:MAG TPA: NUDIX domain-containing protein [Trebonia sp.]|nr:NUDIX domain-containing protein [Trebonia sp.]